MLDQIITAAIGLGILGSSYFIDLIVGIIKVQFSDIRWSWKKMFEDLAKAFLLAFGILGFTATLYILGWYGETVGADLSFLADCSFPALIAGIVGGSAWYLSNTLKNILKFVNSKNVQVNVDESLADYASITKTVREIADLLTPEWVKDDKQTEAKALTEKELDEIIEEYGKGAYVSPLLRRLPDGDNDNNKGWQCSKYSWYLATGIRMNYAPHPDYGPCNGRDMVDYLVNKLGWVRCGKEDGAIFAYSAGEYGHTGMVVDAANNIVNDANWSPLTVSTHYLNLEAVGAVYCKPAEAVEPTPAPAPTPTPAPVPTPAQDEVNYTYKTGDTFGQVLLDLGLSTPGKLWGADGDVAYYTQQLAEQGALDANGNVKVGFTIKLKRRG